mgnify:FL=1
MIIGLKDIARLFSISIVTCCAVFVCTMFLNYNIDLAAVDSSALTVAGRAIYQAQVSMGKITVAVTGGCLGVTSAILLVFYIKNYIDTHGKELGILKAMGYSNISVARYFWVFGLSVLFGCAAGFCAAYAYLPNFYAVQNADGFLPDISVQFHFVLPLYLVVFPALAFCAFAVLYAYLKLKSPALDLMHERRQIKVKNGGDSAKERSFLQSLKRATLKSKKVLAFFIAFAAFCFSAMVQMSISMVDLASQTFAWMILMIGLILAFLSLLLSLSEVVKGNSKTIAMMRVMGYDNAACSNAVLGAYRPFACIGFIIGTLYQYGLLKMVTTFVFSDVADMPAYDFDWFSLLITLVAFAAVYEFAMVFFSLRIKRMPLKSVMAE